MRLTVHPVPGHGAEDVLVDPADGSVLTGTEDGAVTRVAADGRRTTRLGVTGGRPLGLEWLPDGRVLVCDSTRGLLALDATSGAVEPLVTTVDGRPMRFCNNAAVADDGTIYFTDSSRRFGRERWKDEMVQDTRTGRLLRRDPDGTVTTVLDGLAFANGVALAADASWVCVAETAAARLRCLRLTGPRAGGADVVDGLPGYPDNASRGTDGLVWVAIASPVDPVVGLVRRAPLALQRLTTRLPAPLQPAPRRTVRVRGYDVTPAGLDLVHDVDATAMATADAAFHMVTGVREHDGRLWLGSLHEPAVAVLDR
ncbi:SMP-30/gluconolactonase/LRE family protein [Nocardioides lentus]|uniref:SMP-30/gluconolactonase/LRE family protein n=1 Tax=Nocardioides lentus TaxID=338077 RepID=A0ABP5AFV3_9ACTN